MTARLTRRAFWFAAVSGAAFMAAAQQPASTNAQGDAGYVLRQNVRRVILDVVVTDHEGRAAKGLAGQDFTVLEDGVKQPVRSFEPHELASGNTFVPPKLPPLAVNTFVNVPTAEERGPLYVIVYDAVDMKLEDQPLARRQLMDFIAGKPAGTRFAVFLWAKELRLAQGFTADSNKLMQVFDTHREGVHIPYTFLMGANYGRGDFAQPYDVMTFVAHYLEGLPGRKILVWMSSGLPSEDANLMVMGALEAGQREVDATETNSSTTSGATEAPVPGTPPPMAKGFEGSAAGDLPDELHKMLDAMTTARVSIYPIIVHGIDPETHGMALVLDALARATGGRAFFNTNDLKGAIDDIAAEGANYYEISYAPINPKYDGKLRRIQVKLEEKGYHLSYRRFYYADDPSVPVLDKDVAKAAQFLSGRPVATQQGDALYAYMKHGAPEARAILFKARVEAAGAPAMATPQQLAALAEQPAFFRMRRNNKPPMLPRPIPLQTYAIDYTVLDPEFQARARSGAAHPTLEFAAAAYDADGTVLNGIAQFAETAPGPRDAHAKPLFRVRQTIDVPAEGAWLRVAVRDPVTNHIGTLEVPLPLAVDASRAAGPGTPSKAKSGPETN